MPDVAFLTNHGKTLLLIADDSRIRMRDIARLLSITERAAQRIVAELVGSGYIERAREGRRNLYGIRLLKPIRLPTGRDIDFATVLTIMRAFDAQARRRRPTGAQADAHRLTSSAPAGSPVSAARL